MTETRPGHINVQVRLFGRYRSLSPNGQATIRLKEGSRLSELIKEFRNRYAWPDPKPLDDCISEGIVIVVINGRHVPSGEETELKSGDVVGFLSPVAGG